MTYITLVSLSCIVLASLLLSRLTFRKLPLPPGPRGTLFAGVAPLIPKIKPWETYAAWGRLYDSPLISFRVYNQRVVVLNDLNVIRDLLDRRANSYSDRPKAWMYQELCDRKKSVFNVSSNDERHRIYRKLLQTGLGPRAIRHYSPIFESEALVLLEELEQDPDNYEAHFRRNAAAVIMKVAFGYTCKREDDYFVHAAEEASQISGWALAPGRWLVDYFPTLRYIPVWFPFAHFKRQAAIWRERLDCLSGVPHEWTKQRMASGDYLDSFTSTNLQPNGPGTELVGAEQEDIVKWCAGGLYAGAADTTVSAILSFVLLMAVHQNVQKRVQAELDEVIGRDVIPHVEDVHRLPYLAAVLKEVLRFAPVAPLALAHRAVSEDVYNGYRIPKDATVVANVWAALNDPSIYPDPSRFDPSRFLPDSPATEPQLDPRTFSYGFGRRVCPGSQFSEPVMLITMASVLVKFNIFPRSGKMECSQLDFTTGITSRIKPFDIHITPRL